MSVKEEGALRDETARPRIKLGSYAAEILQKRTVDGKITGALLDEILQEKYEPPASKHDIPEWLKDQLLTINKNIMTLRYMVLALAADTDDQVENTLERINQYMNKLQIKTATEAGLDHPALTKINSMMDDQRNQHQEHAIEPVHTKDRGKEM